LAAYAATGAEMWSPYFLGLLAEASGRAGQAAAGLSAAVDALERVERTGARWIEADLHRLRGELLLAQPEPDRGGAEASFRRALAVARPQGAKLWEIRAATKLAKLHGEQGRRADAQEFLAPVHGWFTEGFETPDLRAAGMLLKELR
jgi:predicted ATPase